MIAVGKLVAVGRTSDVYAYGDGSVVKVPRPDVPEHWAEKEARFTAAARQLGAPAPEVKGMVRIDGRGAIVFERIGCSPVIETSQRWPASSRTSIARS